MNVFDTVSSYCTRPVGCFQIMHGDEASMSHPKFSRIILPVSECIAGKKNQYIQFPTRQGDVQRIQQQLLMYGHFPRVLGAIDGTHVQCTSYMYLFAVQKDPTQHFFLIEKYGIQLTSRHSFS